MRLTKSYSFDQNDLRVIKKMEREAGRENLSYSKFIVKALTYWFDHQRLLRQIQNEKAEDVTRAL